jgi:hypothetical protein
MQGSDGGPRLSTLMTSTLHPFDKCTVSLYPFMALQPYHYLGVLILMICRTVGIFRKVNMEVFRLLGVIAICGPEQLDRRYIMG